MVHLLVAHIIKVLGYADLSLLPVFYVEPSRKKIDTTPSRLLKENEGSERKCYLSTLLTLILLLGPIEAKR